MVLDTSVQLIMTTKVKVGSAGHISLDYVLQAICNLGVWCISVQQVEAPVVEDRATPLLTAIVYALDNPLGSLSTTFEAAQVILPT